MTKTPCFSVFPVILSEPSNFVRSFFARAISIPGDIVAEEFSMVNLRVANALLGLALLSGCVDPEKKPEKIEGTVYSDDNSKITVIFSAPTHIKERWKPVKGATVFLSLDDTAPRPIPNTTTETDDKGRYSIAAGSLPKPKKYGEYYLVVKKNGFSPLVNGVKLGPLSRYKKNVVVLAPAASNEAR